MVWGKAWAVDDAHWRSMYMIQQSNDMLFLTTPKSGYLIWWHIADNDFLMQKTAETMARLVCRASLLKSDDPRLKGSSLSDRICQSCDLGVVENIYHLIMQCPYMDDIRQSMYRQLQNDVVVYFDKLKENPQDNLAMLLGKVVANVDLETVISGLQIVGRHICLMYKRVINSREGIG